MWGEGQSFVERYHTDKAVASRSINIFNDNAMMPHFRKISKHRQNQITLDKFLVRQSQVVLRDRKEKEKKRQEKQLPDVFMDKDSSSRQ